jgi:hypothetical protein
MAMAFLMEVDFHPEFPPRPGTLIDSFKVRVGPIDCGGSGVSLELWVR